MASIISATTTNGLSTSADNSGSLQLATNNGTTAVTINTSQNVGIGTTSPSYKLHVNGGYIYSSGINAGFLSQDTSGGAWAVGASAGNYVINQSGVAERMRITSAGALLVGTTNTSSSAGDGVKIYADGFIGSVANSSRGDTYNYYNSTAAAYRFYVTSAGVINATSTTISAISDVRLKENIQDIDVGLDKVMALKPRKFDWKEGKGKDKKGDRGWIAQEFEQVFPEMIDTWKDPAPEGEEPYKSVNADLIPVLVKAIQELKAELDATKAEVQALKGVA